jgi:hypothetical protein
VRQFDFLGACRENSCNGRLSMSTFSNYSDRHVIATCFLVAIASFPRCLGAALQDPSTVEECIAVLKEYDRQFAGLEFDVDSRNPAPASVSRDYKGPLSTLLWERVASSLDGKFWRIASDHVMNYGPNGSPAGVNCRKLQDEECFIDSQAIKIFRQVNDGLEHEVSVIGKLDYSTGFPDSLGGGAACMFGIFSWDGVRVSSLLELPGVQRSVNVREVNGENQTVLTAVVPDYGLYEIEIAISPSGTPLIKSLSMVKGPGNIFFQNGLRMKIGERRAETPVFRDRINNKFIIDEHTEFDGKWLPKKAKLVFKEKAGEHIIEKDFELEVNEISECGITDNSRAVFDFLDIRDGSPVTVEGQEGVAYEFRDGRIVRKLDSEAIGVIDGVRFRKPKTNWLPYALPAVLLTFVGLLVWLRSRRGG